MMWYEDLSEILHSVVQTPLVEQNLFPSELPWSFCQNSVDSKYNGLFLDYQFCSTDLCLHLCQYHTVLITAVLWWGEVRWGEVAQSCLTLCDPMDCNLLGFSIHGILQARVLEWIAISFSRGSSWHRDRTRVSRIGGRRFNLWATREALVLW